jgi:hypothetical protein
LWQRATQLEPDDTIGVFERAAEHRYYDGQELLGSGHRYAGSIYLLGYWVELVLKVAYCRMVGVGPADPIWRRINVLTGLAPRSVRHHDIVDLHQKVSTQRITRGLAVDPVFEGELQRLSLLTASHWKEELRYKSVLASKWEAAEVDEAATWLMLIVTISGHNPMPYFKRTDPQNLGGYIDRLAQELKTEQALLTEEALEFSADAPTIIEETGLLNRLNVTVIWDAWRDLSGEQRGHVIMEAYGHAKGAIEKGRIGLAMGLTRDQQERIQSGLRFAG